MLSCISSSDSPLESPIIIPYKAFSHFKKASFFEEQFHKYVEYANNSVSAVCHRSGMSVSLCILPRVNTDTLSTAGSIPFSRHSALNHSIISSFSFEKILAIILVF